MFKLERPAFVQIPETLEDQVTGEKCHQLKPEV